MTKAAAGVITQEVYQRTSLLFWRHTTSNHCRQIKAKFRALVLISAWCGLRFREAIELRREDFEYIPDSDEPVAINVSRGVTHRSGGNPAQRCRVDTPRAAKAGKWRYRRTFALTSNRI
jgi:hypothetical protein